MMGWKIELAKWDRLKKDLQAGMDAECLGAAKESVALAAREAPRDTGALAASGYTIGRDRNGMLTDGYAEAVAAATALNPRIAQRQELEPPLLAPPASNGRAWAAFYFPLTYGAILASGYYHVGSRRQIPFDPYIDHAANAGDAILQRRMTVMLAKVLRKLEEKA